MRLPKFMRKDNPAYRSIFAYTGNLPEPAWKTVDYASYIKEGYVECAPVHACISMTAKAGSSVRWYVSRGENELDNHPLLVKLARPNRAESGQRFFESVITHLRCAGNAYIYRNSGIDTAPPTNLYWLRPDRMTVKKSGDWRNPIAGYEYSVGIKPEFIKEPLVLHLKEPHPADDWYGLSRIQVAAHEIDTWNESVKWNRRLLFNDMRIPGIVTGNANMDINKFREMWRERYQGADNAGVPLFLDGDSIKWESITGTAKDSDWSEGQKRVLRSICSVMGVPSQLLGDTEATTYANYQEARKAFYLETILPLLDFLRDELNAWLVPLYGSNLYLDYDRDKIDALQEDMGQKYAYIEGARFLSINEKRDAVGYDDIVGGDILLVPISDIPLEMSGEGRGTPADESASRRGGLMAIKATKASFWTKPERKMALWSAFESRVKTREKSFQQIARKYLDRQWADVKTKLAALRSLTGVTAETVFDAKDETDRYVKAFKPWYRDHFIRAGNAGMQASKGKLFDDAEFKGDGGFQFTPEQEARLLEMIFNSGTKVNETTIGVIYAELRQAQAANLTVEEFTQEIWKSVVEFDPWRARLWARTETAKIDNFGTDEGIKQIEFVDMKGWLCSNVPTSRPEHIAADGQEVNVNDKFLVGGELMAFPGDPDASAAMVCNCLCSEYPVIGPGTGE